MLISLLGTTTTLTICLPAIAACTLGSASAARCMASLPTSGKSRTTARNLPFTCTGISSSSARARSGSKVGHGWRNSAPAPPISRRYFAVVDASHGGDDHGETLSNTLFEKDVTVALARSLRQELQSRGIPTLVLRDSDANLSVDQRAVFANADRAAIYIAVHAASNGRGVRIYTALLPYGEDDRGNFRSWTTAQHGSLPLSKTAAAAVAAEFQRRQIPVRTLTAPLRPLNNVIGPAIAIEVAPQGSDASQLTAPDYQQLVTSTIATAIAATRDQLGAAQ